MKKLLKKVMYSLGTILCATAAFVTAHAVDFICLGKYYQPELPTGIEDFKGRKNK